MKRATVKLSYNAPVALTFSILALIVLILDTVTNGWTTINLFCVYRAPLSDPLTWVRFFGHVLGHGSYAHFIGNIVLILVLGPNLEDRFGSWNLLWAILVTAAISGVVQYTFFPDSALLGASGIVFMMILLSSFGGVRNGVIPITLILVAVCYLGGEIWDAIFVDDNVSQLTHVIGGLCGTVLGFALIGKKNRPKSKKKS
jgi:membrane associated rhomboid family serine protease